MGTSERVIKDVKECDLCINNHQFKLQDRFGGFFLCVDHYHSFRLKWERWRRKAHRIRITNRRMRKNPELGVRWMLRGDIDIFHKWLYKYRN